MTNPGAPKPGEYVPRTPMERLPKRLRVEVERAPWSELGPEFAVSWGMNEPSNPQPEHMEIVGMNGSGKTYFLAKIMQERMLMRNDPEVIIATKPADSTLQMLGWPVCKTLRELKQHRQAIFWPQTSAIGQARKSYQNHQIYQLLQQLWKPESNTVIAFDEIAYAESLSAQMRDTIEMYWREGRSQGITVVGMKQRPQGANRHMHSETYWTVAYPPKEHDDLERFAELFGNRRTWMPILESLDLDKREFLIRNTRTRVAYISWIDDELFPIEPKDENRLQKYLKRESE